MGSTPQATGAITAVAALFGALLWIAFRVIRHISGSARLRASNRAATKDVEELIVLYNKILVNDQNIASGRDYGYPHNARVWTELNKIHLQQAAAKRARLLEIVESVAPGPEGDELVHQHTIAEAHARLVGLHRLQPRSTRNDGEDH